MLQVNSYLLLPLLATFCNFLFATFLCDHHLVHGKSIAHHHHDGECALELEASPGNGGAIKADNLEDSQPNFTVSISRVETDNVVEDPDDEKDTMLQKMPGLDFEAYVRADIATFYGKEPGTMVEAKPSFRGQAGKFVNMSPRPLALYWVGPEGISPITNTIPAWGSGGTATHPGHEFVFVNPKKPDEAVCTFTIQEGTSVYYYDPFHLPEDDAAFDPARCVPPEGTEALDIAEMGDNIKQKYRAHKYNFAFAALYKNFTGGSEWLTMYPRNKPRHKIWQADYFGQQHHVVTKETQFHTDPGADKTEHTLSMSEMRRNYSEPLPLAEYRNTGTLNLTLEAVSCAPRAFEIKNFLSDVEVDHMLNLVKKQSMSRSHTGDGSGGHVSETRTSRNTWLPRHKDLVLNTIYQRAADVLRLDEALLRQRDRDEAPDVPTKSAINEDLQVVHYGVGQEYTAHHDFGYPTGNHPDSPSRSINLCMYLNDVKAGGETAFPRWRNAESSDGIKVKPEKGKAMIFYMMNPDGNLDDLTHHAAMPVIEGEKYFVNLWIHDPIRS